MFDNHKTFIGIDPTGGRRPFTYAALDSDLHLTAMRQGSMDEVLAFIAGQQQALVAVCAPQRPNQGLMEDAQVRQQLSPQPRPGRWNNFRLAEYLLRQHNISSPRTPGQAEDCAPWMRRAFAFYHGLEQAGCLPYPQEAPLQWVEVYPHASYCTLLGQAPFPKTTLEGRLQRQLVLYDQRVRVQDPMQFFEEITRHRLMQGILPKSLYLPAELDALSAAHTAWLAAEHPERTMLLGDPGEGQIILPVAELKRKY